MYRQQELKDKVWVEVLDLKEVPLKKGEVVVVEVEEKGLVKAVAITPHPKEEGKYLAFEDRCSHDDAPIAEGKISLEECTIECPRHGARFSLLTGEALQMPAVYPIEVYPTKVEGNKLYIAL